MLDILFCLAVFRKAAWKKEFTLFVMIILFYVLAFSVIFFMTRYILPLLPYLCVMAAGAVVALVKSKKLQWLVASLVLTAFCLEMYGHDKGYGNFDDNMQYLDMVSIHREACNYVRAEFPDKRVLTLWPVSQALSEPHLGYVDKPVTVVPAESDFDLVIYVNHGNSNCAGCDSIGLAKVIAQEGLILHRRIEKNGKWLEVYLPPPPQTNPPQPNR